MRVGFALSALLVLAFSVPLRAEAPGTLMVLQVSARDIPGRVLAAMPDRFTLLEDGNVYVGGTSTAATARLEKNEIREIEKNIDRVRKIAGLGSQVTFGPGELKQRLLVRKGRGLDITATGEPASAPPALRPLASLMADLAAFSHPALRPYRPAFFALSAREGSLPGGCRSWAFAVPLALALAAPQPVAAAAAERWPTGAEPASVCAADKHYVVTLRPLLPGEKP